MLFQSIFATVIAAVSVLGAPLEDVEERSIETRATKFFTPKVWSYNVRNGAISSTSRGVVSKYDSNNGNDITALLTFTYPAAAVGKQCQFVFYLNHGGNLHGSGKLDLYSSNSPAPGPTSGWGPGNQRNQHLGRLSVSRGADATWDATYFSYLTKKTPCKAAGTVEAFELAGVYDNDFVSWNPSVAGPRIVWY
ncbi:hypothetical protein B0J13DRAFT_559513 [Dactylonectria estremocensis]|uniref:Ubiquitin 3 binding protein But2 C-terminal domain-containing protein n=1 Tax=Dactylonectria estremocensis TaxID=1079267 RepID=A0A9P9EFH3_9HYPO|nr:hypothetical protein B0J13DRAFT_559513 [Dactylonectria estremocensis]